METKQNVSKHSASKPELSTANQWHPPPTSARSEWQRPKFWTDLFMGHKAKNSRQSAVDKDHIVVSKHQPSGDKNIGQQTQAKLKQEHIMDSAACCEMQDLYEIPFLPSAKDLDMNTHTKIKQNKISWQPSQIKKQTNFI